MSVTMKDIAQKTGVSIGTVDRALNHRGRINPEVAARIRQVAKELNYKTNSVAKSLAIRSRNLKIAVVLHIQHNNDYYDEVEAGIHQAEEDNRDLGIQLTIYRSRGFDPADQLAQLELAVSHGANAIVLVPIDSPLIRERVEQLHQAGIPVVFLSNFMDHASVLASVHCNYYRSGQLAAGLLRLMAREKGQVLVFSNSFSMLGHRRRLLGFQEQLAISCPHLTIQKVVELPIGDLDSYQLVKQTLRADPGHYIVYSGSAKAGIQAIQETGRAFCSIFYDLSETARNALRQGIIDAVIFQNPHQQGYRAVSLLFEHFTAGSISERQTELIDCSIILRESISDTPAFLDV